MKAIILAAGFGTRLKPLTDKTPKALLPVGGMPLIFYPLKLLKKEGITEVVINLHHLGDLIKQELGDGQKWGMNISYSWEEEILGTGGGIKKSATLAGPAPLLVLNSDVLIDLSLKKLLVFHQHHRGIATMVVKPRTKDSEYTWIELAGDRITKISAQKPEPGKTFFYTGVQILEEKLIQYLPQGFSCVIKEGYQQALTQGDTISGFVYQDYWNDLGTPERLKTAHEDLSSGRASLSFLK